MTRVARVYDARGPEDGRRVLADRLWPRGVRKDDPRIDEWWPEVAPSGELRTWFGHRPDRFEEFSARYEEELAGAAAALGRARAIDEAQGLTLLTATKDMTVAHVQVLARVIDARRA
ncbi:DUF488 domain-containing protein [Nocardioides sp.]|uniref:DUF488 domain-containing protein n=1 Tax=Nocardioides sp. TaxID=35761 RepID=UPI002BF077EF|nr:DUF488 family protein [Nocardioides sp.]HVX55311.1 DUF488 family protein [Nocardioides sp.]